jgi:quercetin dioxygenase-like cupin family protein
MSASQPAVLSPDEGEKFPAGPFDITARASGAQTGGAFELYELRLGPAGAVDYHVHRTMDETIFVLEGNVEFRVGAERYTRPPGSVAFVPRGTHHGFTNRTQGRARVLLLFSPARAQDEYFRELVRLFAAPSLDTEALRKAQQRFDQVLIPTDR